MDVIYVYGPLLTSGEGDLNERHTAADDEFDYGPKEGERTLLP